MSEGAQDADFPIGVGAGSPAADQGSSLAGEGRESAVGAGDGPAAAEGQADEPARPGPLDLQHRLNPPQSPLFHAQHAARYSRQELILEYEAREHCRLIVMIGPIFAHSPTVLEELIYDASPNEDLHLLLVSPGGEGEVAVRLVRAMQQRCRELTGLVPDLAKSAATILALGADHILIGPAGDLGPIDPQFPIGDRLVGAKEITRAVD